MNEKEIEELKKDIQAICSEFVPVSAVHFHYRRCHFISPLYKEDGVWYYDDADKAVYKEPFVGGASELIDKIAAEEGITPYRLAVFAYDGGRKCPTDHHATLLAKENGGATYYCEEFDHPFWLCAHLFDDFDEPPQSLGFYLLSKERCVDE